MGRGACFFGGRSSTGVSKTRHPWHPDGECRKGKTRWGTCWRRLLRRGLGRGCCGCCCRSTRSAGCRRWGGRGGCSGSPGGRGGGGGGGRGGGRPGSPRRRLAQEAGLRARITGAGGAADAALDDRDWQREAVVENDIGWRVQLMVDFMFGKPV